jgi:hypothetical protein
MHPYELQGLSNCNNLYCLCFAVKKKKELHTHSASVFVEVRDPEVSTAADL